VTTLADRTQTALLVIDLQDGVIASAHRRDEVLDAVGRLVDRARDARVPAVWIRHADDHLTPGSDAWQIVARLAPAPDEPVVDKRFPIAFEATGLELLLARLGVGILLVTGAQTDLCVRSTLHGALVRGYDVTLVSDAHTTDDLTAWGAPPPDAVIGHMNLMWGQQRAPGRTCGVLESQYIDFAQPAG
jgi:nicotinamidase-related amidase